MYTRLWLLHRLQPSTLNWRYGPFFTIDHAAYLRRHGADEYYVSAAIRLEVEEKVLLDDLDDMGYLVETSEVEHRLLLARSAERHGLIKRISAMRHVRDGALTFVGLDAFAEGRHKSKTGQVANAWSGQARAVNDHWARELGQRVLRLFGCAGS